jgi:hypothetical protein
MQPEKQLEKLHEVMEVLNKENVTPEEVAKLFELTLKSIETIKSQMQDYISSTHGEILDKTRGAVDDLSTIKEQVSFLSDTLKDTKFTVKEKLDALVLKVFKEIKRVEDLIPDLPDLSPLEGKLFEMDGRIPKLDEGEQIVEKINALPTNTQEFKIDADHIKNLPKVIQSMGGVGGAGIRSLTAGRNIAIDANPYSPGVSLDITVSAIAPSSPVENQLWIQTS